MGFLPNRYVWIFHDWYPDQWWTLQTRGLDCTADELAAMVEGSFVIKLDTQTSDLYSMTETGMVSSIKSTLEFS